MFPHLFSFLFWMSIVVLLPTDWCLANPRAVRPEHTSDALFSHLPTDPSQLNLFYRYLPQLKRPPYASKVQELYSREPSSERKATLILGMMDSANPAYLALLEAEFAKAPSDLGPYLAKALGRFKSATSASLFKRYLQNRDRWTQHTECTEEVIIALGELGDPQSETLLRPLFDKMPDDHYLNITLGRAPQTDRLAGALALAFSALGLEQRYEGWIRRLYDSRSPRASLRAAQVLLKKDSLEAKEYLLSLANHRALPMETRALAGKSLVAHFGSDVLKWIDFSGSGTLYFRLEIMREIGARHLPIPEALKLLAFEDEGLKAEGALALSINGKPEHLSVLYQEIPKTPSRFGRAILTYSWEEIAAR